MQHHPTDNTYQADTIEPSKSIEQPPVDQVEDTSRREVIKKIAVGTTVLAGCSVIPTRWTAPLVEFGALPAHATTSALPAKNEEVITIHWGGNPNEKSSARDRTWWTKIDGSDSPHWHRKFPLPHWIDDKPRRLEFEFSNGTRFTAPDSTKTWMNAGGPKYVPEKPEERDPAKKHPKVGAERNSTAVWVKLKVI